MVEQNNDEISLIDLVDFLMESRRVIAFSAMICLAIGLTGFVFLPAKYEATGTIQMAVVAGQAVESPQVLLEKIKLPLYFSHETWTKCDTDEELTPSRKIAEKIHPLLNKSAPFVSFTVTGNSVKEATECLSFVINDVRAKQEQLYAPIVLQKNAHLAMLEGKLFQAQEIAKLTANLSPVLNIKDEKFSASTLALATKINTESSIKELTSQIEELKISLLPPQTQPVNLASPIYCPDQPSNKKLSLTLAVALILGLVIGVLMALVKPWLLHFRKASHLQTRSGS